MGPGVWVRVFGAVFSLLVVWVLLALPAGLINMLFFWLSAPFGGYIKYSFRYYSLVYFLVSAILYPGFLVVASASSNSISVFLYNRYASGSTPGDIHLLHIFVVICAFRRLYNV